MFKKHTITAYPTDTSFGLGVRADDPETLQKLYDLKERTPGKFFSLMVKDFEMLTQFAHVPADISQEFFTQKPRTALLKPKPALPKSPFWPETKVAFRVCPLSEVAEHITYPITATSANKSGEPPIFTITELKKLFGDGLQYLTPKNSLEKNPPSEIWDYTTTPPTQIR